MNQTKSKLNRTVLSTVGCIILLGWLSQEIHAQKKPKYLGWGLVWSDEFSNNGAPNPANWKFEQGFVRNHEHQWYQPENAYCKKGKLIIEGRKENCPNPNYDANSQDWKKNRPTIEYTSSSLKTAGLHSWKYGR